MNQLFVSLLLILLSSCTAPEPDNHLFILSGQSNMVGLDPEVSFRPALESALGKEHVFIVKDAKGGEPIRRWYKKWKAADGVMPEANGDLYEQLMVKVDEKLKERDYQTVTFLWMQGERDAREQHGEVYGASLRGLIEQLRVDLGRKTIQVIIGRLSDFDMDNQKYPHWTMIRDVQVEVAESCANCAWINTDDLNEGLNKAGKTINDDLHYSVAGYRTLGQRFAERAIQLIKQDR